MDIGTGALLGGIISAAASAGGSVYAANQASNAAAAGASQNERFIEQMYALQYRHAMEAEQRADQRWKYQTDYNQELQRQLLEYVYNNFDSPLAQAKAMRAAGLNPSSLAAGGQSPFGNMSAGSPAVGSPVAPQTVGGLAGNIAGNNYSAFSNPFAGALDSVANAVKSFSEARHTNADTDFLMETMSSRVSQELIKSDMMQLEKDFTALNLEIQQIYGKKRAGAELRLTLNKAFEAAASGHLSEAKEMLTDVQRSITEKEDFMKAPYASHAIELFDQSFKNLQAVEETAKSEQAKNYSSADVNRQEARIYRFQGDLEDVRNEIYDFDDLDKAKQVVPVNLKRYAKRAFYDNLISKDDYEEAVKRINRAERYNNLPEWTKDVLSTVDYIFEKLGSAVGAAAGAYVGARTGRFKPTSVATERKTLKRILNK